MGKDIWKGLEKGQGSKKRSQITISEKNSRRNKVYRTVWRKDYELKDEHTVSNHEINREYRRAQQSGCSSVSVVIWNDPMYTQLVLLKEKETRAKVNV